MDAEQNAASRWRIFARLAESTGRLDRLVRRALAEALSDAQLSENEFLVLAAYDDVANPPSQRQLADRLAVSPAQISAIVERLRQREWIDAQRDPHDRRRQQWRLTDAGVEVIHTAGAAIAARWSKLEEAHECTPLASEALRHATQLQVSPSSHSSKTPTSAERAA
ncbi:MarR family winged helix-turn-helix transcriptional regulator [Blastopirellula sp. JC732]|uniref:MarR family winged helix-turn-helix transcriptional regulator n=1 Tax=Blastopirellula sediminis TaxID=2894196 RepID=A0A9X1MPG0_9BACT|nr:MarR family winged helix-turn-helix transcriptional regulator [Blastopirellula sediminis]MCC9606386.1 MarR family winged helix-turn-helix transcriptional regulator [Blastopirellula sediminis]MCC9630316.1 MarR family winged helix-turn-helix transcriptional regulator [Blastopirellula sediminis]